ncbi:MAG TPA: 2-oxo acid dehydrogenase subunit E2 [Facklamia tabacinasalis]|nr:2-oxo acid dehydrogenase subunit E2 [Ruoffia tabacinasalis]
MAFKFKLPELGEGIVEGEVVSWLVAEGDQVQEDDILVEIQNDKAVEELPSPVSGTVSKIVAQEGEVTTVGQVLIEIDAPGYEDEAEEEAAPAAAPAAPAQEAPAAQPAAGGSNFMFRLPELGEGIVEGEVVSWLVAEGDTVEEDQILVEIQNDKAVEELPSPYAGKVVKIHASEGTVAVVDDILVEIDAPDYEGSGEDTQSTPASPTAEAGEDPAQQTADSNAQPAASTGTAGVNSATGRVLAMPSVRKLARDKGIDITSVTPSGKGGRVTADDVNNFDPNQTTAQAPAAAAAQTETASEVKAAPAKAAEPASVPASVPVSERQTREPMSGMRKAIARAMVNSKHTAPHVTLHDEIEVSKLWDHRKKFKNVAAERDTKLTFLPYVVKALVAAVKKYPVLNASIDDSTNEIVYKNYFNIGIATDTDRGLYVPNIKDANALSMFDIADAITDLSGKAHEGKLSATEMGDGTVTISNIGSAGGKWFTPVINYPEVAILGFGSIVQQPVVNDEGELAVGRVVKLSLSFDHRIVDGATAQHAMNEIKRYLADPELLLMEG